MRSVRLIIQGVVFLGLIVLGIYFGSENSEAIRIVFLGKLMDPMPIWLIVLLSFFTGAALGEKMFQLSSSLPSGKSLKISFTWLFS